MTICPNCQSENVVPQTIGSRRFVDGEVDDNIELVYICLDCFEYVPAPDESPDLEVGFEEVVDADDLPF